MSRVDHGVLYFSIFGERVIQRLDEATGTTSPFFTAEANVLNWDIENGTLAGGPRTQTWVPE